MEKANLLDVVRLSLKKNNTLIVCQTIDKFKPSGRLLRSEYAFTYQALILQMGIINMIQAAFEFLLKPFGQLTFTAQMLAAIIFGPSFLSTTYFMNVFYQPITSLVVVLIHLLGVIFMTFLLTAQIDLNVIKKCGRLELIIGIGSFFIPTLVTSAISNLLKDVFHFEKDLYEAIPNMIALDSTTSIHVIITILTDLKLLNSEIGRIAITSSMISNIIGWTSLTTAIFLKNDQQVLKETRLLGLGGISVFSLSFSMVIIIVFALRPAMVWMMKQTPEGELLKKHHVLAIIIMVILSSTLGDVTGLQSYVGPMILGLVTPVTPPMGSCMTDKLGSFVWGVLLPCFLIDVGKNLDFSTMHIENLLAVEFLIFVSCSVKVFVITIVSLYFKVPLMDAFSLALIMNIQGIYDIQTIGIAKIHKLITIESYRMMCIIAMFHSTILTISVRAFYDSSRRYISYKTHTVENNGRNHELRILACVHDQDKASTIINMLEASNSPETPIAVYILNLEALVGRTLPILVPNQLDRIKSFDSDELTKFDHMLRALDQFQQRNVGGVVWLQCFTAIAPLVSMHDDICTMALKKCTSLVIFPFQQQDKPAIRTIVRNLFEMCPCSVGILTERGIFMDPKPIFSRRLTISVCVVFVGGPDDREALAYAARMIERTNIMLTVVQFITLKHTSFNSIEANLDSIMIDDFKMNTKDNKNVDYVERHVSAGAETAQVLNTIGNDFDLMLVGRRHDDSSPMFTGLIEWSEFNELGVLGDLLVFSEILINTSILVVQQQASIAKENVGSPRRISVEVKT